ncbi:hypothetical protein [Polymorphospora sp. NPDC050346]|uniref:hypothetical protein n=1 Tax=Polymorphospora sp. NPDC050346 TaxID=3155780 RepID=UPI0033DF9ACE
MTNQPWGQQRPPYPHHTQPMPPVQPAMYGSPPPRRRRLGVAGIIGITFGVLLISCCGIGAVGAALDSGNDPKPLASASTGAPAAPADSPTAADAASSTPTDGTSAPAGATPTTAAPTTAAGQVKTTPRPTQTTPRPTKTTPQPKRTTAQPKRTTAAPRTTKPTDSVQQGVHPGAFCKTAGAMGKTKTGKLMQCKKTAEDPKLRWRAA